MPAPLPNSTLWRHTRTVNVAGPRIAHPKSRRALRRCPLAPLCLAYGHQGENGEAKAGAAPQPPKLQFAMQASIVSSALALSSWLPGQLFNGGGGGGSSLTGGGGGGGGGGPEHGAAMHLFDLAEEDSKKSKRSQQQDKGKGEKEADAADDADEDEEDETEEDVAPKAEEDKPAFLPVDLLMTDEEEYANMEPNALGRVGTRRCVEVIVEGWPDMGPIPTKEELFDLISVQKGFVFDMQDIADDRRKLEVQYAGAIEGVDVRTEYIDDFTNRQRVYYKFRPTYFAGLGSVEIKGAVVMPPEVQQKITSDVFPEGLDVYKVGTGLMDTFRERIEKWYQAKGLPFCYVGFFDGMNEAVLRANVIEAKVDDVRVVFLPPGRGNLEPEERAKYEMRNGRLLSADKVVELSGFRKGNHYHVDDSIDAMNNVYSTGLVSGINVEPEQDPQDPSKIRVRFLVEELQPKRSEVDLDWALQMQGGVPQLSRQSLVPGGSVTLAHNNLFGHCEMGEVTLSSSDWRNPGVDLGLSASFLEPFYTANKTRSAQVFSTRKFSPVFTAGPEGNVPPVFVDRLGLRTMMTQQGGGKDHIVHAVSLQRIATQDEQGQLVARGTKVQRGYYADNGPPTTVSGTGKDVSLAYQGLFSVDNVTWVNGNQLGRRASVQVDQGLNFALPLPGSRSLGLSGGLFNRVTASYTKFMQLPFVRQLTVDDATHGGLAPNTLVLNARVGNSVGDTPSYDAYALGGPHSVRGYSPGELGAARRFVEAGAEVRVPLRNFSALKKYAKSATLYGWAEGASDLGSGHLLDGNPTEYYRKAGGGVSVGVGARFLGACRLEAARDCNAGNWHWFVHWGERY